MGRLILAVLLCISAAYASAFDSWEHKRLSDLAYHLAVEIHCPDASVDEMCAELRPETMVDTGKKGPLSAWCATDTEESEADAKVKHTVCIRLQNLYFTLPDAVYTKSALSKTCQRDPKSSPACTQVKALRDARASDDPVRYTKQTALLLWCLKNKADPVCITIKERVSAESQNLRAIIAGCFQIHDPDKCTTSDPDPDERLAWASFFDPLARGVNPKAEYPKDSNLSYGDVTMCVDYFLTPDKLMAGSETALWYPTEDKQIKENSHISGRQLYPTRREDLELSFPSRCKDSYWNLEGARSGHVNHTHFQAELLISQRSQHLLALSLHAVEGNRMAALTANAISDHYLEDSFAPGHITTWRSRLTDLAANAYHDARNRIGMNVMVDRDRFNEMMRDVDSRGKLYESVLNLMGKETLTSESATVRRYFLYPDDEHGDCMKFECATDNKRNRDNEITAIRQINDSLLRKLRKVDYSLAPAAPDCTDNSCVKFLGDSDLWAKGQGEQRLLLLLIQIRSILDVLESAPRKEDQTNQFVLTDSFKGNAWNWRAMEEENTLLKRTIYPPASYLQATIGPVNYEVMQSVEESPTYNHQYQFYDPVYGVNFGIDNMTFGDQQNRWTLMFERVVFGTANPRRDSANFAGVVGIEKLREPASSGYGVTARVSLVKPQTETIFSLMMREVRIGSVDWNRHWRPTYGLRIDQGFTSFATMFFEITRDYAAQKDGRIASGLSVGAGVQIAAPKCRIPLVSTMCDWSAAKERQENQ